jgi:hypothetical protein
MVVATGNYKHGSYKVNKKHPMVLFFAHNVKLIITQPLKVT